MGHVVFIKKNLSLHYLTCMWFLQLFYWSSRELVWDARYEVKASGINILHGEGNHAFHKCIQLMNDHYQKSIFHVSIKSSRSPMMQQKQYLQNKELFLLLVNPGYQLTCYEGKRLGAEKVKIRWKPERSFGRFHLPKCDRDPLARNSWDRMFGHISTITFQH